MKRLILSLSIVCCLLLGMQVAQAQCASYESPYPPPYPGDWPCMTSFFMNNPLCCSGVFDQTCVEALRLHCDDDGDLVDCEIDRCSLSTMQCENRPLPVCPGFCDSYFSTMPPPGPNLPIEVDGILVEIFQFDGFCCQDGFDNLCWEMLNNIGNDSGNPNIGPICVDGDPNTIDGASFYFGCTYTPVQNSIQPVIVKAKVFLEGPYDSSTDMMTTNLRTASSLIPLAQPFNMPPWNYAGTENALIGSNVPLDAVDWVLVEILDRTDTDIVLGQRAGFLLSDGSLLDVDGTDGIRVPGNANMPLGANYYVVIRARGHLAVATASPIALPNCIPYDFTIAEGQAFGTGQMKSVDFDIAGNDIWALTGGDINGDGVITVADFNVYQPESGGVNVYLRSDINKDRSVTVSDFNYYQPNSGVIGSSIIRY